MWIRTNGFVRTGSFHLSFSHFFQLSLNVFSMNSTKIQDSGIEVWFLMASTQNVNTNHDVKQRAPFHSSASDFIKNAFSLKCVCIKILEQIKESAKF